MTLDTDRHDLSRPTNALQTAVAFVRVTDQLAFVPKQVKDQENELLRGPNRPTFEFYEAINNLSLPQRLSAWNDFESFPVLPTAQQIGQEMARGILEEGKFSTLTTSRVDNGIISYLAGRSGLFTMGFDPLGWTKDMDLSSGKLRRVHVGDTLRVCEKDLIAGFGKPKSSEEWQKVFVKMIDFFNPGNVEEISRGDVGWLRKYVFYLLLSANYDHIDRYDPTQSSDPIRFEGLLLILKEMKSSDRERHFTDFGIIATATGLGNLTEIERSYVNSL